MIENYNLPSKILHYANLELASVREMTFHLEKMFFKKKIKSAKEGAHVFVTGLARSGTTFLMQSLHGSEEFASLTYRNMPMILAPNLWARLTSSSQKNGALQARSHGDGLQIDFDSPEALEEVFWKTFAGNQYLGKKALFPHKIEKEIMAEFESYLGLIQFHYQKNRYLSKNNNNILRIESLLEHFPNARILIPFRDPVQQAISLSEQDKRFEKKHSETKFSRKYMQWLAHHEFGADHRPFQWAEEPESQDKNNLDYWISQWISVYSVLLKKFAGRDRVAFVNFEELCIRPEFAWSKLSEYLNVASQKRPQIHPPKIKSLGKNPRFAGDANDVFCSLRSCSLY